MRAISNLINYCKRKNWWSKELERKTEMNCPNCNSKKVVECKGGTCYYPNLKYNWICEDCLNEW